MPEPGAIPPKRPTQYDLRGQPDEDFEAMVARLVRLEFPEAFKPANVSDGGADMVLEGAEGRPGHERCWQAKHYPDAIRWDKCKKSLVDAKKHWAPRHYTFVFPRDLTVGEQKTFKKHFGGEDIPVDYWNGDRLQGLLTGSGEARRVAKTFFSDVEEDKDATNRAIAAGGKLDTPQDALERLGDVGGALASSDAYFMYPSATREADQPGPPLTPGTVMSVERSDGKTVSRIDLVPRDEEATERYGPAFILSAQDTPEGRQAAKELAEALEQGKAFTIGEGLELTPTQLPPGFADIVGQRIEGAVSGTPIEKARPKAEPLRATLTVRKGDSQETFSATLSPTDTVLDGWDDEFTGEAGGLAATLRLRKTEQGGEARWSFTHRRVASDVAAQVRALRFMRAFAAGGELVVVTQNGTLPPVRAPEKKLSRDSEALLAFLEDVLSIERWAQTKIRLPETIEAEDARSVALVADAIRRRGFSITWTSSEMTIPDPAPLRAKPPVRIEQRLEARVLGRVIDLGYVQVEFVDYELTELGPDPDGGQRVHLEPPDGASGEMFQTLTQEPTRARRKPPPPPPRKAHRGKGRKKRRKR